MLPPNTLYRASEALSPPILIPVSKAAQKLPAEMESQDWLSVALSCPLQKSGSCLSERAGGVKCILIERCLSTSKPCAALFDPFKHIRWSLVS
jgi:hypothetical protein